MNKRINILIVDDHPVFRKGLCDILESEKKLHVVADVADGESALDVLKKHSIDVVLLDLDMPKMNGFDFTQAVIKQNIQVKIIILTMHKEERLFARAMDLGINGFISKENTASDIIDCIHTVINGRFYISSMFTDFLVHQNGGHTGKIDQASGFHLLTPTERRVLRLIAENKNSKQIAKELFISPKTVENHRTNICAKLNIHGTHALLRFLLENKSFL